MTTVTSKGQITLPKRVRDELGLKPGSQVDFEIRNGVVRLHRRRSAEEIKKALDKWTGYLRPLVGDKTSDELVEELRGRPDLDEPPSSAFALTRGRKHECRGILGPWRRHELRARGNEHGKG
jgi:AbrB family looped-hinge helix DNA binding protein